MPPMCTYSSEDNGLVKNFHRVHYGSRAIGGTGLIILEATAVTPNGRISNKDLGIWSDGHIDGLQSLTEIIHEYGAKAAIQLGHAGRKSDSGDEVIVSASPIRHSERYKEPIELTKSDIGDLVIKFKEAARRAQIAGFDALEIHAAHGYLIHQFLSPISNKRKDEYGGSIENRTRFLKEILGSIHSVWPKERPIIVRFSATDYKEGGINGDEIVNIIKETQDQFDIAHISTGGLVDTEINVYPGYQIPFAEKVKKECNIPTIAVGLIENYNQIEEILSNQRADLVALGRHLLRDPYAPLHMAIKKGINIDLPKSYERAYK